MLFVISSSECSQAQKFQSGLTLKPHELNSQQLRFSLYNNMNKYMLFKTWTKCEVTNTKKPVCGDGTKFCRVLHRGGVQFFSGKNWSPLSQLLKQILPSPLQKMVAP